MAKTSVTQIDWSKCRAVESVPGKLSGAWVLKGTRMPVSAILENAAAGASPEEIVQWFEGIDQSQVENVLRYANSAGATAKHVA